MLWDNQHSLVEEGEALQDGSGCHTHLEVHSPRNHLSNSEGAFFLPERTDVVLDKVIYP